MEENFLFPTYFSDFFNRLNNTDLIVEHNNRNQCGFGSDSIFEFLQVDDSVCLHWQVSHIKSLLFQEAATIQYTFMIDLSSDDVVFLCILFVELSHTLDGEVITFSSATSENNLFRRSSNQRCNLLTCIFTSFLCVPPKLVRARMRVAKATCQIWKHGVKNSKLILLTSCLVTLGQEGL